MPSFPSCRLPCDTKSPLGRRVEVGGKNMRHSQTFFNELRLMHLETELHNYQCSLSNNNKILKRFKPSKFANSKVRSYFQMSFTVAFFVFCSKRVIKQQIELLMRVSFLDKKTFKITALQGCALTVPGGTWHLTGLLPHNKKI